MELTGVKPSSKPFLAGLVLCAALLFLFPQLATLLPSLLMK